MVKPFDWVLTMLTYIHRPMINDWVNPQEQKLANQINTSKCGWVCKDNGVLWQEFKIAFCDAWTDTSKKQMAYEQLMQLTMNGWDFDTYIATFDHLMLAVGWDLDSEGTIIWFCEGLSKGIHSKALDRDKIPCTINKWKAAAWTEVARAKEKYNAGLTGAQHCNQQQTCDSGNCQNQPRLNQLNQNSGIVPMEVDATNTQINFKKLTPEEHMQLAKEGHCFWCQLQGHMAHNCPKNASQNSNSNAHETTTRNSTTSNSHSTTTTSTIPNIQPMNLTKAQQISAIKELMADKEHTSYLDSHCQDLAGSWYAQRECGAVGARVQWFDGSVVQMRA